MNIPPTSPTDAPSPPPPTAGAGSSSTSPDWYQNLSQHLDTLSLDIQQMRLDHQYDMHTLSEEQDRRLRTLSKEQDQRFETFLPNKLTWLSSCGISFLHRLISHFLDMVDYLVLVYVLVFLM